MSFYDPMDCSLPGSSVHGILHVRIWSGLPCPPPGDVPNSGVRDRTHISCGSCLAGRFCTAEPPGKPQRGHWWLFICQKKYYHVPHTLTHKRNPSFAIWAASGSGGVGVLMMMGCRILKGKEHVDWVISKQAYKRKGVDTEIWGFPCSSVGKDCLQCRRPVFDSWVRKIPWRRKWKPTPVLLPGESHGQRSLAGYSPWGRKSRVQLSD